MIVVNPSTRQFNIPGADLVFGVESDSGSVRKYFQCPRYVGNNLDLAASFIRMNYRNANGEIDSYLVDDLTVDGENITFSWKLYPKVTAYKGQLKFVMCVAGPDTKVAWHTALGTGIVLEGLEPDYAVIQAGTADVVAQLISMVEAQTATVEKVGADQVAVVKDATQAAQDSAVAEIEAKRVNSLNSIPNDYAAMQRAVDGLTRGKAGAIVCEVEGAAITVNDASDLPIQSLKIFGRSTQDGVPTPDAPVEIKSVESPVVMVAGKNLVDFVSALGDGYTNTLNGITAVLKNGVVTTSGKNEFAGWTDIIHTKSIWDIDKYVLPAGTYTVPVGLNVVTTDLVLGTSKNVRGTFAQDNLFCVRGFYITYNQGETAKDRIPLVMVRGAEAPTDYEPYKAAQTVATTNTLRGIPVISGGNYTDANGQQWICDEVDFERGVYVKRIDSITFDGSQTYHINVYQQGFGYYVFGCSRFGASYTNSPVLSDRLTFSPWANWNMVTGGDFICYETSSFYFYLRDQSIQTIEDFKAYLEANPISALYVMANPTETPLSETEIAAYRAMHTNKPNTTIVNDGGAHMKVEYAADTKLYIDNKFAALMGK